MPRVLYALAAFCCIFAATQLVADSADLRIGLACIAAAILVGSGAVTAAIDRCRPRPVSKNNGGGMAGHE